MPRGKKPRGSPNCLSCGGAMPETKRSHAKYCTTACEISARSKQIKDRKPKIRDSCAKCGCKISDHRRSDTLYCGEKCRSNAEKLRYKARNPEYVARQNRLVKEIHHMKEHGHTRYIDNPVGNPKDRYARARAEGFRSMLEVHNARFLEENGVEFEYEPHRIPYKPPTKHYIPDLVLWNGIYIETKGRFVASDRAKHLLIKEQYPDLDVRFVFSNASSRLSKASSTTYAKWCDKHGFQYAEGLIPIEWTKEPKK